MDTQKLQTAVAYAALMIHDAGKEINEENINKVLKAAGIEITQWVKVFAKMFTGEKVTQLLESFSSAAPVAAAPAASSAAAPVEEKKEEEKPQEEEEEDDFGGFGDLF